MTLTTTGTSTPTPDQVDSWLKKMSLVNSTDSVGTSSTASALSFKSLNEHWQKKQWHPLTLLISYYAILTTTTATPTATNSNQHPVSLKDLYDNFVCSWESFMNPVALVQFVARVAQEFKSDWEKALTFLTPFTTAEKPYVINDPQAKALATMEVAALHLRLGRVQETKEALATTTLLLDSLPSVEPAIHAALYRVAADYYKAKAMYPQFYHNALLFLSCITASEATTTATATAPTISTPITTPILTLAEKQERAYDLAIAALLGDGLYQFGDLLMHPILAVLKETSMEWLRAILLAFHTGDAASFDKIVQSSDFTKQNLLVNALPALKQKFCLMSLIEYCFRLAKPERVAIPFKHVAQATRVPADQVEHLIMRALSLGLVRGKMDQLAQTLTVTWVLSRPLEMSQVALLRDRLGQWAGKVEAIVAQLEATPGSEHVFSR